MWTTRDILKYGIPAGLVTASLTCTALYFVIDYHSEAQARYFEKRIAEVTDKYCESVDKSIRRFTKGLDNDVEN